MIRKKGNPLIVTSSRKGTDVIASDLPTEVGRSLSGGANKAAAWQYYFVSLAFGAGSQICSEG